MNRKLSIWKCRNLSIGGRVLLNLVLSTLLVFLMSFYKVPKKVIKDIFLLQSRFFWHGNEDKKGSHWLKWSNVCKPKEEGGLGVRNVILFNEALLLKWKWRFIQR